MNKELSFAEFKAKYYAGTHTPSFIKVKKNKNIPKFWFILPKKKKKKRMNNPKRIQMLKRHRGPIR